MRSLSCASGKNCKPPLQILSNRNKPYTQTYIADRCGSSRAVCHPISEEENASLKKKKYSEDRIRDILTTAYPDKTDEEIEAMVQETMAQYLAEAEEQSDRAKKNS